MPARRGGLGGGAGEGGGGARGGLGGDRGGGGRLGGDRGGGGGLKVHHRQTGSQWLIWRLSQLPWGANDWQAEQSVKGTGQVQHPAELGLEGGLEGPGGGCGGGCDGDGLGGGDGYGRGHHEYTNGMLSVERQFCWAWASQLLGAANARQALHDGAARGQVQHPKTAGGKGGGDGGGDGGGEGGEGTSVRMATVTFEATTGTSLLVTAT